MIVQKTSEKPRALLFFDMPNIFCAACDLGVHLDIRRQLSELSGKFSLEGRYAFVSSRTSEGLYEALLNMGFVVFERPYNCDALMGFKISEYARTRRAEVVIIGTHDGDFSGIAEELERVGMEVYFLGFEDRFSSFLRPKPCLPIVF